MKHCRSDNGVFTAKSSTYLRREEGRSQCVSGVGAQHQNSEVERYITTVMYMARSTTLHCDLHWDKHASDNLALQFFALDHVAWFCNKIPWRISGFIPPL